MSDSYFKKKTSCGCQKQNNTTGKSNQRHLDDPSELIQDIFSVNENEEGEELSSQSIYQEERSKHKKHHHHHRQHHRSSKY